MDINSMDGKMFMNSPSQRILELSNEVNRLQAENDKLKNAYAEFGERFACVVRDTEKKIKTAKIEVITKFVDKLNEESTVAGYCDDYSLVVRLDVINTLLKGMEL